MGIRCLCPNGHRLNIKSFLAGKRGICPDCGVKFTIPTHSDPDQSRNPLSGSDSKGHEAPQSMEPSPPGSSTNEAASVSKEYVGPTDEELRLAKAPPVGTLPVGTLPVGTLPVGEEIAVTKVDPTEEPIGPIESPANSVSAGPLATECHTTGSNKTDSESGASGSVPREPVPDETAPDETAPDETDSTARNVETTQANTSFGQPSDADGGARALTEWYVQIADGQRFGPADNEMMQVWVSDGRVAPENLVHQRGWPAWKTAADVFPELTLSQHTAADTESGDLVFHGGSRTDKYRGRAAAKSRLFKVVTALGVASVALLAALIYVVRS